MRRAAPVVYPCFSGLIQRADREPAVNNTILVTTPVCAAGLLLSRASGLTAGPDRRAMSQSLLNRDLRAILRALPKLYSPTTPAQFPQLAMSIVCELLPAPYISYDEVDPLRGVVMNQLSREPPMPYEEFARGWEQHAAEHPILNFVKAGGTRPVVTISDFLTQRQFEQTGLYDACFRPGGMTHQIGLNLPAPERIVGMGITRDSEFTARERAIIEAIRPHMAQARMNAFFFGPSEEPGAPHVEELVLQLDEQGGVKGWPHRIQLVLLDYFDCRIRGHWAPPQTLLDWIKSHFERIGSGDIHPKTFAPLVARRETKHLTVRFFYSREQLAFLTFEENEDSADSFRFAAIGLTRRESEILAWVAQGKRDAEIAQILQSSARTVSNHVYRILSKLGVETRTAAVADAEFRLRRQP